MGFAGGGAQWSEKNGATHILCFVITTKPKNVISNKTIMLISANFSVVFSLFPLQICTKNKIFSLKQQLYVCQEKSSKATAQINFLTMFYPKCLHFNHRISFLCCFNIVLVSFCVFDMDLTFLIKELID